MATRVKKKEKVSVGIGEVGVGGCVVLDGKMLPEAQRLMHVRVGGVDCVISLESIKCKLKEMKTKFDGTTVEEELTKISEAVSEQVEEVYEYVREKNVKENVFVAVYDFLCGMFHEFVDNMLIRAYRIGESILAILYRFLRYVFGLISF